VWLKGNTCFAAGSKECKVARKKLIRLEKADGMCVHVSAPRPERNKRVTSIYSLLTFGCARPVAYPALQSRKNRAHRFCACGGWNSTPLFIHFQPLSHPPTARTISASALFEIKICSNCFQTRFWIFHSFSALKHFRWPQNP